MEQVVAEMRGFKLAHRKNEVWRNVDFTDLLGEEMHIPTSTEKVEGSSHCSMLNHVKAIHLPLENGFFGGELTEWANGVIFGGVKAAQKKYPQLVAQVAGHCTEKGNLYEQSNGTHFTDGIFLYIPDNIVVKQPFQLQSIVACQMPAFVQVRNLVYVGRNSQIQIIQCDDSINEQRSFSNNVTEIFVNTNGQVEYYKMQNLNDLSGLISHSYVRMQENSRFRACAITLNGGSIRNHCEIRMDGEGCDVRSNGLYLIDKTQRADNYIFVEHRHPHCTSHELYKGIMDDSAYALFNGHVLVDEGAVKTEAYQSNKNILLNDKAFVNTKPFLEIYNDDVKCSHGSTIGQLDEQALFYIRSRGISERTAKTLLLYAFCDEVIQSIQLDALRESLSDMVKKRLHGELTPCQDCALHCNTPCNGPEAHFTIDTQKL